MERIRKGYYVKVNPYNSKQKKVVSLLPKDVDAIVFWTKNPKPLMKEIHTLENIGYNFYFQFTLNDFPGAFEPTLPSLDSRVKVFQELSKRIGPKRVIWRYDPIIYSSVTPLSSIVNSFQQLASKLEGYTERVVISFVDMYGKTKNKFGKLEKEHGIEFYDLTAEHNQEKLLSLCTTLKDIASSSNLEIFTCAEKIDLDSVGIKHGACIDKGLLEEIFGLNLGLKKDTNQRSECLCVSSEEMGTYNTCKFNCTYCYAVQSEKSVYNTTKNHNWKSPLLIGELNNGEKFSEQLKLF